MSKETWIVHLSYYSEENDGEEPSEADDDSRGYCSSLPLELPGKQGWNTALSYELDSMGCVIGLSLDPPLPKGGAYVRATFYYESSHMSGLDGDSYDWEFWLESYEFVSDDVVAQARRDAKLFRRRELYWMKKAGCAHYEMRCDGVKACALRGRNASTMKASRRTINPQLPGCNREPGRICPVYEDWKPLKDTEFTFPTNHFLDGTGVCRYAGAEYDPEFAGHQFVPSLQKLAEKRPDLSIKAINDALLEQARDANITYGKFSFWFTYPGDDRSSQDVKIKGNCARCSGLLQYPDDCPYFDERPLKKTELIVPCTEGQGTYGRRAVAWRFVVLDIEHGPIHHAWQWGNTARWSGVREWGQWWQTSNAFDSTVMWTSYGIPVSGGVTNKPMWRGEHFDTHKIRKALSRFEKIFKHLKRIEEMAGDVREKRRSVSNLCGMAWRLVAEDAYPLLNSVTVYGGDGTLRMSYLLPKKVKRWHRPEGFRWDKDWDYGNNLHILARYFFHERLMILALPPKHSNFPRLEPQQIRKERRLFDQMVNDPWLRVAYGLEGAPDQFWVNERVTNNYRPEHQIDAPEGLSEVAGRCMTEDAYERFKVSINARYF
jgi:hypothetical protein